MIYFQTAPQLILSGCTTQMVTPPLRGVCCRSVCQAYGEQLVTSAFTAMMMEVLLVDNLDIMEAKSVSIHAQHKAVLILLANWQNITPVIASTCVNIIWWH